MHGHMNVKFISINLMDLLWLGVCMLRSKQVLEVVIYLCNATSCVSS